MANAWIRQSTQPSVDLEIINEIASMVDAWVRQRTYPSVDL